LLAELAVVSYMVVAVVLADLEQELVML